MKKLFKILIVTLFMGQSIQAQKGEPIRPYKEGSYPVSEVKTLAFATDLISPWWRQNLVMLVNNGLVAKGKTLRVDETNIYWILDHTSYQHRKYGRYTNSHLLNKIPGWYVDADGWEGVVAVFDYDGVSVDLFKGMCTNLVNIPLTPSQGTPTSTTIATTSTGQPITINNYNIIKGSGNSDVAINGGEKEKETEVVSYHPVEYSNGNGNMMVPYSSGPRISFGLQISHRDQQYQPQYQWPQYRPPYRPYYHYPQQPPPHGYMGGGRPSSTVSNHGNMGGGGNSQSNYGNQGGGRAN